MIIVALAVSDLLMMQTMGPPVFVNVFMDHMWAFGVLGCKLYGFLGGVFGDRFILFILLNHLEKSFSNFRAGLSLDDHHDWL